MRSRGLWWLVFLTWSLIKPPWSIGILELLLYLELRRNVMAERERVRITNQARPLARVELYRTGASRAPRNRASSQRRPGDRLGDAGRAARHCTGMSSPSTSVRRESNSR